VFVWFLETTAIISNTELTGFYNRDGVCLQPGKKGILKCHSLRVNRNFKMGCVRSQAVSCRPLNPEARLRS